MHPTHMLQSSFVVCVCLRMPSRCILLQLRDVEMEHAGSQDILRQTWDETRSKQVNTALLVDQWGLHFAFVRWLADWLGRISNWIGA